MKLFEYCIILKPNSGKKDAKVIVQTTTVLAEDENEIKSIATLNVPAEYKKQLDEIVIVSRAFNNTPFVVYD